MSAGLLHSAQSLAASLLGLARAAALLAAAALKRRPQETESSGARLRQIKTRRAPPEKIHLIAKENPDG